MRKTYAEKLLDPRWQKLRLITLESANWACEVCGAEEKTLHVHHNWYVENAEPWDYSREQLTVVCEACHDHAHNVIGIIKELLSRTELDGPENLEAVMWFLMGVKGYAVDPDKFDLPWKLKAYKIGQSFDCLG